MYFGTKGRIVAESARFRAEVADMPREFYNTRLWLFTTWLGLAAVFIEIALRT
ncbi:MAG: hypothetical protein H0W87_09780 [Actinobacteria bacterium]|nr:hypothetical protein [Actinomycetota bacterium]